jgi:HK97 family phage portal protein
MGFFDWLTGYRAKLSGRDGDGGGYDPWGKDFAHRATPGSVMGLAAAWACVRLRSRVVGSLPATVVSKAANGARQYEADHWLAKLLQDSPNAEQTPYEFWSNQVACIDLYGNGYSEKTIGALGRTTALTPFIPDRVTVRRNADGDRVYDVNDRGKVETLPEDKVLHLRGLTLGGDVGLSAIAAGCQSMSGALAAESTAANLVRRGLQISGFMETGASKLSPEQRSDLVNIFNAFTGSAQAGKIMPLEKDFKFQALRMNPVEAQLLESRGYNTEEICRWFDTPPILIGHAAAGQTMWGSGVEQIFLGWLTMGLNPLLTSIQQAARKQLLPPIERAQLKVEFNREALLAADSAARAALYSSLGQNGVMTRNEMREKENLPPMPGGDVLTVQSNLLPIDKLGTVSPTGASHEQSSPIRQ